MTAPSPPGADRIRDEVREFLARHLLGGRQPGEISERVPLLGSDIVDSIGFLQLVVHLEETYGIEIPQADVIPEHFGTLACVVRYLAARTGDTTSR